MNERILCSVSVCVRYYAVLLCAVLLRADLSCSQIIPAKLPRLLCEGARRNRRLISKLKKQLCLTAQHGWKCQVQCGRMRVIPECVEISFQIQGVIKKEKAMIPKEADSNNSILLIAIKSLDCS